MNVLEERALRNSLRGWVDEIEPALPYTLRDEPYWQLLADAGRRAPTLCHATLVDDAAAWLHEAVLPAVHNDAVTYGFGPQWTDFTTHRTARDGRRLIAHLDHAIDAATADERTANAAHHFAGTDVAAATVARARGHLQRLRGLRRVVFIAAYDRTVAGSAAAARALLQAYPDRIDLLATIDPIGALLILSADVGAEPVLTID